MTIDKQYQIIGINFNGVDAGTLDLNTLFPYTEGMTQGGSATAADSIQIRNDMDGYDTYYMSNGKSGKNTYANCVGKWVKSTATTVPASVELKSGDAFWYVSKKTDEELSSSPYNIVVAGSVLSSGESAAQLTGFYSIVSSPYPVDVPLNDCFIVENGTTGASANVADAIQIRNDQNGYDVYYLSNGKSGKNTYSATIGKWVKSTATTVPAEASLPAGQGCWFVRQSSNTSLKIANPTVIE